MIRVPVVSEAKVATRRTVKQAKFWIGLGASAGGLEALRGFVRNLPKSVPVTYIVAQHMAPHHRSLLSEIIGRETELAVRDVTDNVVPKPNTIYITPPNKNIVVEGNRLRLAEPSREPAAPKPSVDTFFKSLALAKGEFAVGIVLSGTGSDGSKGIAAIRAKGGIAIAQDELTAKYASMPIAALETGCIDLVMSPEEIGAQIAQITKLPRDLDALRASPLNLDGTAELIQLLLERTKVNFRNYKTATFQRRVERRMAAKKTPLLEDYVNIARTSESEVQLLFKDLLISVTSFFRDMSEFEALKPHIEKIVQDKKGEAVRIWVPGMATGEEAYSIAIMFFEAMASTSDENIRMQIFATDIDVDAIEVARRGFYSLTAFDQVPPALTAKYFDRAPSGYTVKKFLREKLVFSYHNVAQDPPFLNIDMISCRNLLIYFQSSLQAEVFGRFHYSLMPNGLLFLGKSEAVAASEILFRQASRDKHIFYQRPSHERRPPRDFTYQQSLTGQKRTPVTYAETEVRELAEARSRFDSLVEGLGPNALLVGPSMNIIKAYGSVGRFVSISPGLVDTRVTSLLTEPYRQDVQSAGPSVIRNLKVYHGISRRNSADPHIRERISIYPIRGTARDDVNILVVFAEWREETIIDASLASDASTAELLRQISDLGNELAIAKSNLQQTVEELETSNEELQALNEELQSSNEELQSTNEELETSNEELQSTNEELSTVNEELQVSAQQLNIVNHSLASILENVSVPMMVVDRGLHITHASKLSERFFGISADLAQPHVSRCRTRPGYPNLVDVLNQAMDAGIDVDCQINQGDESATMKIVPHFTASGEMVGAIVLVSDNTEELRTARNELQLIFDNVPAAIMVRDVNGIISKANPAAQVLLRSQGNSIVGTCYYDYFAPSTRKKIVELDQSVIDTKKHLTGIISQLQFNDGHHIWARQSRIFVSQEKSKLPLIYSMKEDITEQHNSELSLRDIQLRLEQAIRASKIGLWDWHIDDKTLYCSPRLNQMLAAEDNYVFHRIIDLDSRIHPDDWSSVNLARRRHFEERYPYEVTYRMRRGDGSYIWVRSHGEAIFADGEAPVRFIGTIEDISQQRELLISVAERKEQLELAAKLAGVGHWRMDLNANTLFWSEQVFSIYGIDPARFLPTPDTWTDLTYPDDVAMLRKHVSDAVERALGFEFESRIVRDDGAVRTIKSVGVPTKDERGRVVGIFGVFQDVTDLRQRELKMIETLSELGRSNEELNRFSYVCSHDMKEPVRMIESMAALLVDPEFEADEVVRSELLGRISANTSRLRAIIDSLLAYSRIDAKVETTDVDLNAVLTDICESLSLAVKDRGATIEVGPLPTVNGAKVHFTQLFQNLIGNALKYTDNMKPLIRLKATDSGKGWEFVLDDNGPGIPEESRVEIFRLFSRLKRRDEVEGTGLGLSIAQRIVMQYGGSIECGASELGGAAFTIFLPHERTVDA